MVEPEMQVFCPRIDMLKEKVLKQSCDELWFVRKCHSYTFKVNFLCQKSTEEFQFKRPFFVKKHFFLTSIFEPLYFLRACPIFDKLVLLELSKYNGLRFPFS